MRSRRSLLSGTAALAALAGCLGFVGSDGEDPGTPTPGDDGGTDADDGDSGGDGSGDDRERRQSILDGYEAGARNVQGGTELLDRGLDRYDSRDLETARDRATTARGDFEDAREEFSTAAETADEVEHKEARGICSDAVELARLYLRASEALVDALDARESGNLEDAERYRRRADDHHTQAENRSLPDYSTLRSVLDLE